MWKVISTVMDRTKDYSHRKSPKYEMEPTIAGQRLKIRQSILITDKQKGINEDRLKLLESQGVIVYRELKQKITKIEEQPQISIPLEIEEETSEEGQEPIVVPIIDLPKDESVVMEMSEDEPRRRGRPKKVIS